MGNQGLIPEREPEKWLPHPRKAAGVQITHSRKGEVVIKNNNTGFFREPVIGTAAAAAAKALQSCPTLCDPIEGSPPGFPSLGFSRQEHWSGLPFPSPMHESEK